MEDIQKSRQRQQTKSPKQHIGMKVQGSVQVLQCPFSDQKKKKFSLIEITLVMNWSNSDYFSEPYKYFFLNKKLTPCFISSIL